MQLLKSMTRLKTITKKKCFEVFFFLNRYALRLFDIEKVGHSKVSWRKKKRIFDRMYMFSSPELVRAIGHMIVENEPVYRR